MRNPLTHAPWTVVLRRRGRERVFTRLHPVDALRFESLAARCAPAVSAAGVGRGCSPSGPTRTLDALADARIRYRRRLQAISRSAVALVTDVHDCYPSCRPEEVARALGEAGCSPGLIAEVHTFLEALTHEGVPGLPVGPRGSDTFAESILVQVDRCVPMFAASARWVDDMVFGCIDPQQAAWVAGVIAEGLEQRRLRPSRTKTRVIRGGQVLRTAAPSAFGQLTTASALDGCHDLAPVWTYNRK